MLEKGEQRARNMAKTLQDIIDRDSTPPGERDAAKNRLKALHDKYDLGSTSDHADHAAYYSANPFAQSYFRDGLIRG